MQIAGEFIETCAVYNNNMSMSMQCSHNSVLFESRDPWYSINKHGTQILRKKKKPNAKLINCFVVRFEWRRQLWRHFREKRILPFHFCHMYQFAYFVTISKIDFVFTSVGCAFHLLHIQFRFNHEMDSKLFFWKRNKRLCCAHFLLFQTCAYCLILPLITVHR